MPSSLLHFLAEWRRARRVVQITSLDVETLLELAAVVTGSTGEVDLDGPLANTFGIGCWQVDLAEAEGVRQWFTQAGLGPASDEVDTNDGENGDIFDDCIETVFPGKKSPEETTSPSPRGKLTRQSTYSQHRPSVIIRSNKSLLQRRQGLVNASRVDVEKVLRASSYSMSHASTSRAYNFLMRAKENKDARFLLFRNPSHPLSGFPAECSREAFVLQIRRYLCAEELFTEGIGQHGTLFETPMTTVQEAEDLFDALMLTQSITCFTTGDTLQTGLIMDRMVRRCEIITIFRQLIEKDQATLNSFLHTYFTSRKQDSIDAEELHHFFRGNSDGSDLKVEDVLTALDESGDGKIDIYEFQLMMGLVAPPRPNMVEVVSQLELKHGFGRCGMNCQTLTRRALYQHMATVEKIILPPEDVVRLYRSACGSKFKQEIPLDYFLEVLKSPSIGITWGVDVHMVHSIYDVLGCRALCTERAKNKEASLAPEALLDSTILEPDKVEARFQDIWERYGKPFVATVSSNCEMMLEEGCYEKFKAEVAASAASAHRRAKAEAADRRSAARIGERLRSAFPNIGDVLATGSTRLLAGQTCLVRYRLQGACCFLGPGHTVLRDEREPISWPPARKMLGDTAFIALVPRGLSWVSAGGGGFYSGNTSFSGVDPNLRAALPMQGETGQVALAGVVEISMPSVARSTRGASGKTMSRIQQFDLRLFCSTKNRIVGVLGDPLPITVIQQVPPPPCESLQSRCEGRSVTLRWAPQDLGMLPKECEPDLIRIHIKSSNSEQTESLGANETEFEMSNLDPDTEYEFRARYENSAGSSPDSVTVCRTNAVCPAPGNLTCATVGTAHVELQWTKPFQIGNERTKDAYQVAPEKLSCYSGMLRVMSAADAEKREEDGQNRINFRRSGPKSTIVNARPCWWKPKEWKEEIAGLTKAPLTGLRPDTLYCLSDFRAHNSVGLGVACPPLEFWTIPLTPCIDRVRVRQGKVLLSLSQIGGLCVKHYEILIWRHGQREEKANTWQVKFGELLHSPDSKSDPGPDQHPHQLPLPFSAMPSVDATGKHNIRIRAYNAGGHSEWSAVLCSAAIARQQGADLAQAALISAIQTPVIETLEKVLEDCKGIEFEDDKYVHEATRLLERLLEVRHNLQEATKRRDPEKLRLALQTARDENLPDLQKPEALLKKLDKIVEGLETAKGIVVLRVAIHAAEKARLPTELIEPYRDRLEEREAAQKGLENAMEVAKVNVLQNALKDAEGMDLPTETEAQEKLAQLEQTQNALINSMKTKVIPDISGALTMVTKSGLKEPELISKAREMLGTLLNRREHVQKELDKATRYRHPGKLKKALVSARLAQVDKDRIQNSDAIRKHADKLLDNNAAAVGIEQREKALEAGRAFKIPDELMDPFQDQLEKLKALHKALRHGDPEVLRNRIQDCDAVGIKNEELLEARVVYKDWGTALLRVEVETSVQRVEPLTKALEVARAIGVNEQRLDFAAKALHFLELRAIAEKNLQEAIEERKLERVVEALSAACEAKAYDYKLVQEAHDLQRVLKAKRADLETAVAHSELPSLHRCLQNVREHPALPEDEIQGAENLLLRLRDSEFWQLATLFDKAEAEQDFRAGAALLQRARLMIPCGVSMKMGVLEHAEIWTQTAQDNHRDKIEQDIMKNRYEDSPSSKAPSKTAEFTTSTTLPLGAVRGELHVAFEPAGSKLFTLPREVIECTIEVAMPAGATQNLEAREREGARQTRVLLNALDKLVGLGDTIEPLSDMPDMVPGDKGRRHRRLSVDNVSGVMGLPIVIYIRDEHRSLDIVNAMCRRRCLGFDLFDVDDGNNKDHAVPTPMGITAALSESFTSSLFASVRQESRQSKPLQLADHIKGARARVFRSLTVEFSWSYPRGIFDGLACSCIVFDNENLVDIIDCRGAQGRKYGAQGTSFLASATDEDKSGMDCIPISRAVRHVEEVLQSQQRRGKQVMEVRLDLLPASVSDLVFMLSPANSRDLTKFDAMTISIFDTEAMELLISHDVENPEGNSFEAALTTAIARKDGLWNINRLAWVSSGSHRDYRPALLKLSEIGFPRNSAMRNLVQPLLTSMQVELGLPVKVKSTVIQTTDTHSLQFGYAMELREGVEEPNTLIRQIMHPRFTKAMVKALRATSGMRFGERHLHLHYPERISLRELVFELQWQFPPVDHVKSEDATFEDMHYYMDGACIVFEGQSLRELVDYRGAHGVRWVTNGVLDYRGLWVGPIATGDASGGAVQHDGYEIDNVNRFGKTRINVRFDSLPVGVSDFYLVLTSHAIKASDFSSVSMSIKDQHNLSHEVEALSGQTTTSSSASGFVMCRVHRSSLDPLSWSVDMSGSACLGRATDYRPALEMLWEAQATERCRRAPQWPSRVLASSEKQSAKERPKLRLPAVKMEVFGSPNINKRVSGMESPAQRLPSRQNQVAVPSLPSLTDQTRETPREDGAPKGDALPPVIGGEVDEHDDTDVDEPLPRLEPIVSLKRNHMSGKSTKDSLPRVDS